MSNFHHCRQQIWRCLVLVGLTVICCAAADVFQRLRHNGHLRGKDLLDDVNEIYNAFILRVVDIQTSDPYVQVTWLDNSTVSILDWCGELMYQDFDNRDHLKETVYHLIFTKPAYHNIRLNCGNSAGFVFQQPDSECHCTIYNVTLRSVDGEFTGENFVNYEPCPEGMYRDYLTGKLESKENTDIRSIGLRDLPIHELNTSFLDNFPNLEATVLVNLPLANDGLPDQLLCQNRKLQIVYFKSSFGYLREFPRQIFNCSKDLLVKDINFVDHDIASLPAHAFGSAASSLRLLRLEYIGLETIDELAFYGVTSLEYLHLEDNKLRQISGDSFPANMQPQLNYMYFSEPSVDMALNIRELLPSALHEDLQVFHFSDSNATQIVGQFCEKNASSDLQLINLYGNLFEVLPVQLFDGCHALRYLRLDVNWLEHLNDELFSTNYNLEMLDLSLNYLSDDTPWSRLLRNQQHLVYLNISYNNIATWNHLLSLQMLVQLDLSWNVITTLAQNAFDRLPMLEFLSLEGNLLHSSAYTSPPLESLAVLLLGMTGISEVYFSNVTQDMLVVDASECSLRNFTTPLKQYCSGNCQAMEIIVSMNHLEYLHLTCSHIQDYVLVNASHNNLTDFYSIFPSLRSNPHYSCTIATMDVSRNHFTFLGVYEDFDWYRFYGYSKHTIEVLKMQHCGITLIDPSAFIYFQIQSLDLRYNNLQTIGEFHGPSLGMIDLRNNQVACECSILWLKKHVLQQNSASPVQYLIEHCVDVISQQTVRIESVLDEMFLCPALCPQAVTEECTAPLCYSNLVFQNELDAVVCPAKNQSSLSPVFARVSTSLHLTGANLMILDLPYDRPSDLVYLNATECRIAMVPDDAFTKTPRLQHLILARNRIHTLSQKMFKPLIWLQSLDLSENEVTSFEADMILPMRLLRHLYLHSNQLEMLDSDTLRIMQTLSQLSLYHNPWSCECNSSLPIWVSQQQNILVRLDLIRCEGSERLVMNASFTCPPEIIIQKQHFISMALASSLSIVLAVCLVASVLVYKFHFLLMVLAHTYLPDWCSRRGYLNNHVGLFAIYDDQDRYAYMWIKDELIPALEPDFPIICSDRDFVLGQDVMDNVEDAIRDTNCALVLVTQGFLDNIWSRSMFEAATMAHREKGYKIIPVFAPEMSVRSITSHDNCSADMRVILKTCKSVHVSQKLFWESVRYLLPKSRIRNQQTQHEEIHNQLTLQVVADDVEPAEKPSTPASSPL